MRLILILSLLLPTLALAPASACERPFRAGLAAFRAADRTLVEVEATLYRGLGWATRARVLERLEGLSARSTACQEVTRLNDALQGALDQIARARAQFSMAQAVCLDENRRRAEDNLGALTDTAGAIRSQIDFLADLATRC
ncbi:MAG: hypothetical protein R3D60_09655 [Paracoccaceae bacterium]